MAKKKKEINMDVMDESMEKESTGSKIVSVLIGIIVFVILLSILAVCIKLDVGGIGKGVLRPILKDVPVINKILPDVSDETLAVEQGYMYDNLPDAIARIKELEAQVKEYEKMQKEDTTTIADLQKRLDALKELEANHKEFTERVEAFDKNVVFNEKAPDIEEYKQFYEGINAENAAEIYRQVVEQQIIDEKLKEQADRYAKMEPAPAADALQVMTGDLDIVADILMSMSTKNAAAIMNEMDPDFCAKITKKMSLVE